MVATVPIVILIVCLCFIITFLVIFVLAFKKNKKKLEEKLKERKERGDDGEKKRIVQGPGMPAIDPECQRTEKSDKSDDNSKKKQSQAGSQGGSQAGSQAKKSYASTKNELETPPSTAGGSDYYNQKNSKASMSRKPSAVDTVAASEAASKQPTSANDHTEIDLTSEKDSKKSSKKKSIKGEEGEDSKQSKKGEEIKK